MAAGFTFCEYVSFIKPGISRRDEKVLKIYSYLLFKKKEKKIVLFFFFWFYEIYNFFFCFLFYFERRDNSRLMLY